MRKNKLLLAIVGLLLGLATPGWAQSEVREGTFFIKNVSTKTFLTGANTWGTQASLDAHGLDCKLTLNNGAYTIMTGNSNYLGSNGYVDSSTADWTIEAVDGEEKTYTIYNSTFGYLVSSDGSTTITGQTDKPSSSAGYWQFFTQDDMANALDWASATEDAAIDVTFYIDGCNFVRNCDGFKVNGWGTLAQTTVGPWTVVATTAGNQKICGPKPEKNTETNQGCEFYGSKFDLWQEINVPNGKYKLSLSGFDTGGGAVIYANYESAKFTQTTSQSDNLVTELARIDEYSGNEVTVTVTNKTLKLGVKREGDEGKWTAFDNFRLYYLGEVKEYVLNEDVTSYKGTIPTAAYSSLKSVADENNKTYTDADKYNTAKAAIDAAKATADALVAPYASAKTMYDAVSAIDDDDSKYTDESEAASTLQSAIADVDIENMTTAEDLTSAASTLKDAATAFLNTVTITGKIEVTDIYVTNPSFETGDKTGWTITAGNDAGVYPNTNETYTIDPCDGDYVANAWQWNSGTVSMTHDEITDLPAGYYTVTAALASHASRDLILSAKGTNEMSTTYNTGENAKGVAVDASVEDIPVSSTLTFGVSATYDDGETFVKSDNWRLYIQGEPETPYLTITASSYTVKEYEDLPEYEYTVTNVKGEEVEVEFTTKPTITVKAKDYDSTPITGSDDGEYTITVTGAKADGYKFNYTSGTLTITEANYSDITENLDFTKGYVIVDGICTTAGDRATNGVTRYGLQPVAGWTMSGEETDGNRAGGMFAYGSKAKLMGDKKTAPSAGPNEETEGNCLGILAVWGATSQYTCTKTLEAGSWTLTIPVYNAGGTKALTNLMGVSYGETKSYASTETYTAEKWTTETINFTLDAETEVTISLGYTSGGEGSGTNQHLFVGALTLDKNEITRTYGYKNGTICYEYELTPGEGTTIYEIKGRSSDSKTIYFSEAVTKTTAGKPYIYEATVKDGDNYVATFNYDPTTKVDTEVDGENGLYGTFEGGTVFSGLTGSPYVVQKGIWVLVPESYRATYDKIGENKAYIKNMEDVPTVDASSAKSMTVDFDSETTGINSTTLDSENGDIYNIRGQKVNKAQKGVYIQNGQKIVIK